ncbi:hypothetical protein F511_18853 [Dorcoceras hygrometricum]|uniref:Uncharacterized protein n=1 Tax=Dorcoceras hygrometricum TaxID=472368 RepID=A0A2Z7DE42_9LAMI|nr:hypothetical protein F511_18853 [Dorcoceras hygrometricum]
MSCARWTVPEGVALVSCENMQVGSDVHEDGSAGATEPAGVQKWISCCANVNESDVNVKRNLESAMMTDVKQILSETAEGLWSLGVLAAADCGIGSVHEMLTREVESDTVAEKELKTVKRDFGGLNEEFGRKGVALVSCENMKVGSDVREDGSAGATEPAGAQRWISCCANVNESYVNVKRNLESAMMMSAFLLEEAVVSNYDVSNISRQQDGSATVTSAESATLTVTCSRIQQR